MNLTSSDLMHDQLVAQAARAIGAAQRAVVSAAYGDLRGYLDAAEEHYNCAARVSAMEDAYHTACYREEMQGNPGLGFSLKKLGKFVSKTVSKATEAVKTAGLVLNAVGTAIGQPIEKALPKGVVNVAKAGINVALAPTKLIGMALTDPKNALKKAPGMLLTTPLVSAMKVTAEVGKIAGSNTVIGGAARKVASSANQLQNYSNANPVKTLAAAAAVAAVVVSAGMLAAPAAGAATAVGGGAAAAGGAAATATVATAATATAATTGILGTGITVSTALEAAGAAIAASGKDLLLKEGGKLLGGGGSSAAANAVTAARQQQAAAAAAAAQRGDTALMPALAAAGVGFLAAGPIGALIGGGAGFLLGKPPVMPDSVGPTTAYQGYYDRVGAYGRR